MLWDQLHDYWLSKHDRGRAPARADLDPIRDIPTLTPNLMLIDVLPDGYRVRLQGSEIVRRTGIDLTGRVIDERLFDAPRLVKWFDAFTVVVEEQRPLLIRSWADHRGQAETIVLVLPLVGTAGQTEILLVGCFYEGDFDNLPDTGMLALVDVPIARRV